MAPVARMTLQFQTPEGITHTMSIRPDLPAREIIASLVGRQLLPIGFYMLRSERTGALVGDDDALGNLDIQAGEVLICVRVGGGSVAYRHASPKIETRVGPDLDTDSASEAGTPTDSNAPSTALSSHDVEADTTAQQVAVDAHAGRTTDDAKIDTSASIAEALASEVLPEVRPTGSAAGTAAHAEDVLANQPRGAPARVDELQATGPEGRPPSTSGNDSGRPDLVPGYMIGPTGRRYALVRTRCLVGRADPTSGANPDIDLTADDPRRYVHRQHVVIENVGDSWWVTLVPTSKHPVTVNGQPLILGQRVNLKHGDRLMIATTPLDVWLNDRPAGG